MGVYVKLSILSDQIPDKEWNEFYDESLIFLKKYSDEIMGFREEIKGSIKRHVYSREIEHNKDDPQKRHWAAIGDFFSKETGETFCLYYDINHYFHGKYKSERCDDILLHMIDDYNDSEGKRAGHFCDIFNNKTQGYSYHIPMLAVAMICEDRFTELAAVSGNIDIYQARKAKILIREILNKEVHLPVCTDTVRLYNRIKRYYNDIRGIHYFELIYRGSENDLYKELQDVYDIEIIKQWFIENLMKFNSPASFGAIDMFIAWLNATQDLETLCNMACIDPKGPGFNPVEFASALASTWISIDKTRQGLMDIFLKPRGETDTVFSQFGMMLMDMGGFKGRNMKFHLDQDQVLSKIKELFPLDFPDIKKTFVNKNNKEKEKLDSLKDPVARLEKSVSEDNSDPLGDTFPVLESMKDATKEQRFMLKGAAAGMRRLRRNLSDEEEERLYMPNDELINMIILLTEKVGPKLSEDAWNWIDNEDNTELLRFLVLLVMIDNGEQKFWNMRKGILENKKLAKEVFELYNDPDIESVLEELEE
ncbi:Uncharacterized protein dnl_28330 [Desulfonema limicola]|uniref:Uncharacterized protein n=1 Tax=Desulfonema limicola TaxID=45656 RepID=A0A975B876_9BACT|nr:hypothetical protein [Desulfonema limicola]QTA80528.1 Uncharacterized protein dnl_28330 [Desulfonema limicola]